MKSSWSPIILNKESTMNQKHLTHCRLRTIQRILDKTITGYSVPLFLHFLPMLKVQAFPLLTVVQKTYVSCRNTSLSAEIAVIKSWEHKYIFLSEYVPSIHFYQLLRYCKLHWFSSPQEHKCLQQGI